MIIVGFVAKSKGYYPSFWILAAGSIGAIVLLALPSATGRDIDETTRRQRKRTGNRVGAILSVMCIALMAGVVAVFIVISKADHRRFEVLKNPPPPRLAAHLHKNQVSPQFSFLPVEQPNVSLGGTLLLGDEFRGALAHGGGADGVGEPLIQVIAEGRAIVDDDGSVAGDEEFDDFGVVVGVGGEA
jgi:hypothetical protein